MSTGKTAAMQMAGVALLQDARHGVGYSAIARQVQAAVVGVDHQAPHILDSQPLNTK